MSSSKPGPLAGTIVLELGSLIAGPYCGQLLGDLGAEVIKIEPPKTGDALRDWGQQSGSGNGVWWATLGRNKRSVTCNLRTPEGQDIIRRIVPKADVLIENFRPGTMARWGLSDEVLSRANPEIIIAHVSGYGQDGPYAQRAGYASIGEAMAGTRYLAGYPDRPPVRAGLSIGDSMAGIFSCIGVLAALHERKASKRGQVIDTAIYESMLALTESLLPDYGVFDITRERTGPTLPGIAPSNAYSTRDGSSVLVAANQDTVFVRLSAVMGQQELSEDERFSTHIARGRNQELLDRIVEDWTCSYDSEELLELLNDAGVPAGRINTAADILDDPHIRAREAVAWQHALGIGRMPMPNVMPRLSRTPGAIRSTGPGLGDDTERVLQSYLDMTPSEIEDYRARNIV